MKKKLLGLFSIVLTLFLLVGCFEKSYKVQFDLNNGTSAAIAEQTIKSGGLVRKPIDPTRENYNFTHWTLDGERWDFETSKVKANITLKAEWELKEYTVTFDVRGGAPAPAEQTIAHGSKATEPEPLPALEGNEFLGWYLSGRFYNFDNPVTEDITLIARWGVRVTFNVDGGTPAPFEQVVLKGTTVQEPTKPTREHATFLGWYHNNTKFNFDNEVEQSFELHARWSFDYDAILVELEEHYANTFGDMEWHPTENVELLDEICGVPVTWSSSDPEYFANNGEVTIPPYSVGDKTIMLTASLTPIKSTVFLFVIEAAEETVDEMLERILDLVTIVPSTPSGYQEQNFETITLYRIGEEDVTISWESSDEEAMKANGEIVPFVGEDREVTLTATMTYQEITKSKSITFLIKPVIVYEGLTEAYFPENQGVKLMVTGVRFFSPISARASSPVGYYIASADNQIGYIHASIPTNLKDDKLYDVIFELDIYYGSYQLKNAVFINERDGDLPVITPIEMTLDQLVELPKPLDENMPHTYVKLTDVKVFVADPNDQYKTFLVNKDFDTTTPLTDKNSIMVYYQSDLSVIKSLDGRNIDDILLINNGYRTDNVVWYVNYIGDGSDINLTPLSDAELVSLVNGNLNASIPYRVIAEKPLPLIKESEGVTISWASDNEAVINPNTGAVAFAEAAETVILTAQISKGEESITFSREVWVGTPTQLPLSDIAEVVAYDGNYDLYPFKIEGVVTGITGNRQYSIYDGTDAMAIRMRSGTSLELGYKYTIVGCKNIYMGLIRMNEPGTFVKGEEGLLEEALELTETILANETELVKYQSHLVNVAEADVTRTEVVDDYGTIEITLKIGEQTLLLRWDNRVTLTSEAKAKLQAIEVGDLLKINAAPLGWFNGAQLGYHDASQIETIYPETDEEKVSRAIRALNIPEIATSSLTLPTEGRFETSIVWSSDLPEVIADDGTLVMPEVNTDVELTAEITSGEYTKAVKFYVFVQVEAGVLNVKLTRAVASGQAVVFKGVVSGMDSTRYVYVSDVDGTTIVLFEPTRPAGLAVGDRVKVEGSRTDYNGLIQIGKQATVTILAKEQPIPAAITVDTIPEFTVDDQGRRFNIENLLVVSVSGRNLILTDGEKEVRAYVDPNDAAIVTHIGTAAGKKVNLVNIHLGWYNVEQFLIGNVSEVVVVELNDQEKAAADLREIELPEEIASSPLNLPNEGLLHNSVITWSSDNPIINTEDGTVTLPTENVVVKLTATATKGESEASAIFYITVKPEGSPVLAEATMEYAGPTTNMESGNNASAVGLHPLLFSVESIKGAPSNEIGLNTAGQLRLYSHRSTGDGNTLSVSIAAGNAITSLEIYFVIASNQATTATLMLGEEEVLLTEADLKTTKTYSDLNISNFTLKNTHMGGSTNGQIWISKIVIRYLGVGAPQPESVMISDFLESTGE